MHRSSREERNRCARASKEESDGPGGGKGQRGPLYQRKPAALQVLEVGTACLRNFVEIGKHLWIGHTHRHEVQSQNSVMRLTAIPKHPLR